MEIPFIGGAYKGRSADADAQECQNLYVEIDEVGGKEAILVGTPGLVEFADIGIDQEVRGMRKLGSTLYVVCGYGGYSVSTSGVVTTVDADAFPDISGRVSMATDGVDIVVSDGTDGYFWDVSAGTILEIKANYDSDFTGASYVTFQDGYFIVAKPSTGEFYLSDSYDGTSWDATMYATAERHPDNLVACISDHSNLWLLGEETVEIWYNSGATVPFDPVEGAFVETGVTSAHSMARASDTIFWLDNDLRVRKTVGFDTEIVSTPQIEYRFAQYTTTSNAIGYAFIHEGRTFYILTFPSHHATWLYCLETNAWFKLTSYPIQPSLGNAHGRHRSNCYERFNGKNLVGDYNNGKIYYFSGSTYTDDGNTIIRQRVGPTLTNEERKTIFYKSVDLLHESGTGLTAVREIWNCSVSYVSGDTVTYNRLYSGTHDGSANASALTDSSQSWEVDELKGMRINNTTDGSSGLITANTGTTVTATLAGGTDNDWDASDAYTISDDKGPIYKGSATGTGKEPPDSSYWDVYPGADPQVMLQWSDDRGHTWSNEHWASLGMLGEHGKKTQWRKLGRSKNRTFKIVITDPVKVVLLGMYANAEEGSL